MKQAKELLDNGQNYSGVGLIMGYHPITVAKKVRQYEIYGSSLFSKDPAPIISIAYDDTESFLRKSSPFSFWLSQQRSSPQLSSEFSKKLASLDDTLDNLSFYLSCPSDHTSSQS